MKLHVPDWKSAWFENHISDRFFQEMGKLEKGVALTLESSGEWTEQAMVELGALAQAMLRLEDPDASPTHLRQAGERAMRLGALAVHLSTALDQAQRGVERVGRPLPGHTHPPGAGHVHGGPPAPPVETPPSAASGNGRNAAQDAGQGTGQSAGQGTGQSAGQGTGQSAGHNPGHGGATPHPGLHGPGHAARTARSAPHHAGHAAPGSERTAERAPDPMAETPAAVAGRGAAGQGAPVAADEGPLLSPLAGRRRREDNPDAYDNEMRNTILSLSKQGLSRAEIEVVTGQPRDVVDAVLAAR